MTRNNSKTQIYNYLQIKKKARADDLWRDLGFSRQLIQRKLKELIDEKAIQKSGKTPLVFYEFRFQTQI